MNAPQLGRFEKVIGHVCHELFVITNLKRLAVRQPGHDIGKSILFRIVEHFAQLGWEGRIGEMIAWRRLSRKHHRRTAGRDGRNGLHDSV